MTFEHIIERIVDHDDFTNVNRQMPLEYRVAIWLWSVTHHDALTSWAERYGKGTVLNAIHCVTPAFLGSGVRKEVEKRLFAGRRWLGRPRGLEAAAAQRSKVPSWSGRCCCIDGRLVSLAREHHHEGRAFYDRFVSQDSRFC